MNTSSSGSEPENRESHIGITRSLNPNASEFVPTTLKSSLLYPATEASAALISASRKSEANPSMSSLTVLHEAQPYWYQQLPDDITHDFEASSDIRLREQGISLEGISLDETDELSTWTGFDHTSRSWNDHSFQHNQLDGNQSEAQQYDWNSIEGIEDEFHAAHSIMDETCVKDVEKLASMFPGFASDSLTDVYIANGCDINLTIDILIQLELQVNGVSKSFLGASSTPNLSSHDFPLLTNLDDHATGGYTCKRDSSCQNQPVDFASAVRKFMSHDSRASHHHDKNSADTTVCSSQNSSGVTQVLNGGVRRQLPFDRSRSHRSARELPSWLETGETVANMYSAFRDEARDHARLRNAYFEQATQAYLLGNKALAKELSMKGKQHNLHMKAAHEKAQESIYRLRNPVMSKTRCGSGQGNMIDLHGLHVSEAIHMLRRELAMLRRGARSSDQSIDVFICVGTGHHTKGSRTTARLPVAVQQYLLEEGLNYCETIPGLLRVSIC